MLQTAPSDTAAAVVESPRLGDSKRSVALAALGGVVALVLAVVVLGGGDGERVDRPAARTASEPAWRHGESVLPAAWLASVPHQAPRPKPAADVEVAPEPAAVAPAPVVPAPPAPAPVPAPALPQPAQPGEDFNWQQ